LIVQEKTSDALSSYIDDLRADNHLVITGRILETEIRRVAQRTAFGQEQVTQLLKGFEIIEHTPAQFREAGIVGPTRLRSLDALHLATALAANASAMITLDQRLIEACSEVGLPVLDFNIPREYVTT
jgi:uncharacterized protein